MFESIKFAREKRVLSKVLQDKEDNLICLQFDLMMSEKEWQEIEPKWKQLEEDRKPLQMELDELKRKGSKEIQKIVELEKKLSEVDIDLRGYKLVSADLQKQRAILPLAKKVVARLKEAIKNPKQIYEFPLKNV